MLTVSELVDKSDIPAERKNDVKKVLHDLGYAGSRAVGKAFLRIEETDMTDAGVNIADASAILAEVKLLQGVQESQSTVIQEIRDELRLLRDLVARKSNADSTAISTFSRSKATQLLDDVLITELDGFAETPLETPADAISIDPFDFSQYMNEDAATPDLVSYHQRNLQICGVNMGRSGYQVLNLLGEPMYQVQIGDKTYSVGVNGGVVPHAVRTASAADVLRIGFQHKQSTQDRAIFQTNNPHMSRAEVAAPRPYTFEEGRDQAVCCLLAAHQLCQLPLDLDLTDGKHHHLLRLRGDFLLVYEDCAPTQAYHEMAKFLKEQAAMLTRRRVLKEPPEELEEELCRPIKKLKGLAQGAALAEQVQSLLPFCSSVEEQVCTAYQMPRVESSRTGLCVKVLCRLGKAHCKQ